VFHRLLWRAELHCRTIVGRQVFVAVAEMVLAELRRRIAQRLQQFGDRRVFLDQADRRRREADFGQPSAQSALTGEERYFYLRATKVVRQAIETVASRAA